MQYSKEQIIAHRIHWAEYLQQPHLKKYKRYLANPNNEHSRCCLGHGVDAFELEYKKEGSEEALKCEGAVGVAPKSLIDLVGLYSNMGTVLEQGKSLAAINDETDATPQEIGVMLESWIEGGPNTPFVSLNEYN